MRMEIRLIPNASRDEIAGRTEDGRFRVRVQSPPVEGAANNRLVRFLSGRLGVSKSKIRIIGGEKSRDKILEIDGDESEMNRRMEGWVE
ncbi:MAG: DUF167 domain-containing protein [Candidatus Latescibacterota bacterium]